MVDRLVTFWLTGLWIILTKVTQPNSLGNLDSATLVTTSKISAFKVCELFRHFLFECVSLLSRHSFDFWLVHWLIIIIFNFLHHRISWRSQEERRSRSCQQVWKGIILVTLLTVLFVFMPSDKLKTGFPLDTVETVISGWYRPFPSHPSTLISVPGFYFYEGSLASSDCGKSASVVNIWAPVEAETPAQRAVRNLQKTETSSRLLSRQALSLSGPKRSWQNESDARLMGQETFSSRRREMWVARAGPARSVAPDLPRCLTLAEPAQGTTRDSCQVPGHALCPRGDVDRGLWKWVWVSGSVHLRRDMGVFPKYPEYCRHKTQHAVIYMDLLSGPEWEPRMFCSTDSGFPTEFGIL